MNACFPFYIEQAIVNKECWVPENYNTVFNSNTKFNWNSLNVVPQMNQIPTPFTREKKTFWNNTKKYNSSPSKKLIIYVKKIQKYKKVTSSWWCFRALRRDVDVTFLFAVRAHPIVKWRISSNIKGDLTKIFQFPYSPLEAKTFLFLFATDGSFDELGDGIDNVGYVPVLSRLA